MYKCNRLFGGHTAEEVADLLDGLCRSADRCEANSQQEIAAIAARGRDALRALLAKPVATREAAQDFWRDRFDLLLSNNDASRVIAAISHFAPPARPKMIEGMEVQGLAKQMREEFELWGDPDFALHCARVAHRLASTPVPEVDPDEGAKDVCWAWHKTFQPKISRDDAWDLSGPNGHPGWRAVAAAKKEAGDE